MYLSHHLLRSLDPAGMSAAEQRAADEQQGRTAAAIAASWRRTTDRARGITGRLSLAFRNKATQPSPQWADELPPCVRHVPEPVAKSQLNGHAVR